MTHNGIMKTVRRRKRYAPGNEEISFFVGLVAWTQYAFLNTRITIRYYNDNVYWSDTRKRLESDRERRIFRLRKASFCQHFQSQRRHGDDFAEMQAPWFSKDVPKKAPPADSIRSLPIRGFLVWYTVLKLPKSSTPIRSLALKDNNNFDRTRFTRWSDN